MSTEEILLLGNKGVAQSILYGAFERVAQTSVSPTKELNDVRVSRETSRCSI